MSMFSDLHNLASSLHRQDVVAKQFEEWQRRSNQEAREQKERELEAHQAIILTLQKQEAALQVQIDTLLVQKESLAAQWRVMRWNGIVTVFAVLLGSALTLFVQWLKQ